MEGEGDVTCLLRHSGQLLDILCDTSRNGSNNLVDANDLK